MNPVGRGKGGQDAKIMLAVLGADLGWNVL